VVNPVIIGDAMRCGRVRTVEYEPGWGWIARSPYTGREIIEDFRWRSRDIARAVVREAKWVASNR
jgi:hypothetical protein